eukprot:402367-Pyramimonas_sp.AAC.1
MVVHLSHLISKAGGQGVADIGRDLVHSRNSTRALKTALGFDVVAKESLMWIQAPVHVRKQKKTALRPLPFLPVYEVLALLFPKKGYEFLSHRSNPRILCK